MSWILQNKEEYQEISRILQDILGVRKLIGDIFWRNRSNTRRYIQDILGVGVVLEDISRIFQEQEQYQEIYLGYSRSRRSTKKDIYLGYSRSRVVLRRIYPGYSRSRRSTKKEIYLGYSRSRRSTKKEIYIQDILGVGVVLGDISRIFQEQEEY